MTRSIWKGNFIDSKLSNSLAQNKMKNKIWSRSSTIPESLLNKIVFIYNGKTFVKCFVSREKIGFKFGEFSPTRIFNLRVIKSKDKKKQKTKSK